MLDAREKISFSSSSPRFPPSPSAAAVANNPTGQSGALPLSLSFSSDMFLCPASRHSDDDGMDGRGHRGRERFHEDELRFASESVNDCFLFSVMAAPSASARGEEARW